MRHQILKPCNFVFSFLSASLSTMSRDSNFTRQYTNRRTRIRVLVDMDQVLADFEGHFLTQYKEAFPGKPFLPHEERLGFWIQDQYVKMGIATAEEVSAIWNKKDFFKNLPPLPGAVDAVKQMAEIDDVDVFICTSPINKYRHCLQEKYGWIEKHLGQKWIKQIVLTKDKTIVNGHLLIDDKVDITGAMDNPSWEHIVFTSSHNRNIKISQRRLDNWTDDSWRDLIADAMKRV